MRFSFAFVRLKVGFRVVRIATDSTLRSNPKHKSSFRFKLFPDFCFCSQNGSKVYRCYPRAAITLATVQERKGNTFLSRSHEQGPVPLLVRTFVFALAYAHHRPFINLTRVFGSSSPRSVKLHFAFAAVLWELGLAYNS